MKYSFNKIMHKLMLSCDDATKLIALKRYHKISWLKRIQLSLHLMACNYCRTFEVFNDQFDDALQHSCDSVPNEQLHLSSEKKEELKEIIRNNS